MKRTLGMEAMNVMGKLLCKLGFHFWKYDSDSHRANRCCCYCERWERPVYDTAYGGTYYLEGRNHYVQGKEK